MKRNAHTIPVLAMLLATCCTPVVIHELVTVPATIPSRTTVTIPVYIEGFAAEDSASIGVAVDQWNHDLNGNIVFRIDGVASVFPVSLYVEADVMRWVLIMQVDSSCTFIPKFLDKPLAWTDQVGGTRVWIIRDRMKPEDVEPVTLHELGHVLGAKDRLDGGGLMFYAYRPQSFGCVDLDTMVEVSRHYGLQLNQLSYCKEAL